MPIAQATQQIQAEHSADASVLIVGSGPIGVRTGQLLAQKGYGVTILGDEAHQPYNRVRLTPLLGGDVQFGEIELPEPNDAEADYSVFSGHRVMAIDRKNKRVITRNGAAWPYTKLILATGSKAFVPNIPGNTLPGVYTFRTADDASALLARSFTARHVAIIGGGLLGLEAARGLQRRGCKVTVIEHEARLMPRQLDLAAGTLLAERIEALGVSVHIGIGVAEMIGQDRVERIRLGDGKEISCDTVVICTGVRANTDLARDCGLGFNRGIMVNGQMQTSDPDIFAVGECAQFEDYVVGLVGPGYAQAEVAAAVIAGEVATFERHIAATKLKVIGADVFSIGDVEQLEAQATVRSHVWEAEGLYRRIFIERGRLAGVIAIGAWDQASRMKDAAEAQDFVYPWMLRRFRTGGSFWTDLEPEVADLPDGATICNCTGVNCGQIRKAISSGAGDDTAIGAETGAGTVCGTCRPLLSELVDAGAPPKPITFAQGLLGLSGVALSIALAPLLLGYVPLPENFDADSLRVWAWRDNIVKQWSGLILLGIVVAAMMIGLRKRIRFMDRFGSYDGWRLVHVGVGILAALGLFAHTGFRLGANVNFLLGASFVGTLLLGAMAGMATGGDHQLRANRIGTARKPFRRWPTWLHIAVVWPLPVLILLHVLTIYAF